MRFKKAYLKLSIGISIIIVLIVFWNGSTEISTNLSSNILDISNQIISTNCASESSTLSTTLHATTRDLNFQPLGEFLDNNKFSATQDYMNLCGVDLKQFSSAVDLERDSNNLVCTDSISRDARLADSSKGHKVPDNSHHILPFRNRRIFFHHLISILSVYWVHRPRFMFLWSVINSTEAKPARLQKDRLPTGEFWSYLLSNLSSDNSTDVPRVLLLPLRHHNYVYGSRLELEEHISDVLRLEVLYVFGGFYVDMDVIVVKDLRPLYKYSFTIGRETSYALCNGFMLSSRENRLVHRWHRFYKYQHIIGGWALMSVFLPHKMWLHWPEEIHVEDDYMDKLSWQEHGLLFGPERKWDWRRKNYGLYLFVRLYNQTLVNSWNFTSLPNNTFGDIVRFILFGKEKLP